MQLDFMRFELYRHTVGTKKDNQTITMYSVKVRLIIEIAIIELAILLTGLLSSQKKFCET